MEQDFEGYEQYEGTQDQAASHPVANLHAKPFFFMADAIWSTAPVPNDERITRLDRLVGCFVPGALSADRRSGSFCSVRDIPQLSSDSASRTFASSAHGGPSRVCSGKMQKDTIARRAHATGQKKGQVFRHVLFCLRGQVSARVSVTVFVWSRMKILFLIAGSSPSFTKSFLFPHR